jgi:hypothetical protein
LADVIFDYTGNLMPALDTLTVNGSGFIPRALLVDYVDRRSLPLFREAICSPAVCDHCPYMAIRLPQCHNNNATSLNNEIARLAVDCLHAKKIPSSSAAGTQSPLPTVLKLSVGSNIYGLIDKLSEVLINITNYFYACK